MSTTSMRSRSKRTIRPSTGRAYPLSSGSPWRTQVSGRRKRPFAEHDMRPALDRLARPVAQDGVLGWFAQRDVDEAGARGQATVAFEDLADGLDLLRRQRLQRMPHRHPLLPPSGPVSSWSYRR